MANDLTRPIIGIENRTAQEVFDIMSARIKAALRAGGKPVAFMHADHVEQYKNKTADGIFWANNERTDFYTVPLFAHPAPSCERELAEARAEIERITFNRDMFASRCADYAAERKALAADNARLVERGWAFANQVRAVTYLLNGQAYSSTLSELNAFTAALGASIPVPADSDGMPCQIDDPAQVAEDLGLAAPADKAPVRETVPAGQTPLDKNLEHRLLEVINEGAKARDTGAGSPYHGHSLEHCLHAIGWVQRDLRLALDVARDNARREALEEAANHARCAFDDRPRRSSFDDGTKAAAAAIRALANTARQEGE